jgi:O-antigen/teichoic acid export membrane protein
MKALQFMPSHICGTLARLATRARESAFAKNAFYLTGITGIERVAALVQTILIARALGITEYGIYGLLFSTIGFVASVMGLQMGLTATVFVARYREHEKGKAGAVIRYVTLFALLTSAAFLIVTLPFAAPLSSWLLKSEGYALALVMGCLFVAGSLVSGVQDGVAEGFEDFRAVAIARLISTVLALAGIYPAATRYGLDGVLVVLLAGVAVKYAILATVIARHRSRAQIPHRGGHGVSFLKLVKDFSLPSMLAALLWGAVTWFGTYLLSRQVAGFAAVAIVNVGLQWRGPILLVTGALGRVAVPVFSRHEGANDAAGSHRFKRKLMRLNLVAVLAVVAVLVAISHWILAVYGKDFHAGTLVFAVLVISTIPKVLADVHMQYLVGHGRMWRQLGLYMPMMFAALIGFVVLIPMLEGLGYALAMLASASAFFAASTVADIRHRHMGKNLARPKA